MAVLLSHPYPMPYRPQKRRRTATSVMAGHFDPPPAGRDVLTSLLNGVGPNKEVEGEEEAKKLKKRKDQKKDKRQGSSVRHDLPANPLPADKTVPVASTSTNPAPNPPLPEKKRKSFWSAHPQRPNIHILTMERSVSVTPPPGYAPVQDSSASATPGPSMSTATSRTSSKRPRTPEDHEEIVEVQQEPPPPPSTERPRKKRTAAKKGWKGWVEGSPPPSDKLINLDSAPVMQDRRLRSGKNFDAISVGKDSWV